MACKELFRVLKPGDFLVMVWNNRDESYDWVRELTDIMDPYCGDTPRSRYGKWKEPFEEADLFGPLQLKQFDHSHFGDQRMVLDEF